MTREAIGADFVPDTSSDKVYLADSVDQVARRHANMQADHDRRQKQVLKMLAWGPVQGYQAHLDRAFLLREVERLSRQAVT